MKQYYQVSGCAVRLPRLSTALLIGDDTGRRM